VYNLNSGWLVFKSEFFRLDGRWVITGLDISWSVVRPSLRDGRLVQVIDKEVYDIGVLLGEATFLPLVRAHVQEIGGCLDFLSYFETGFRSLFLHGFNHWVGYCFFASNFRKIAQRLYSIILLRASPCPHSLQIFLDIDVRLVY